MHDRSAGFDREPPDGDLFTALALATMHRREVSSYPTSCTNGSQADTRVADQTVERRLALRREPAKTTRCQQMRIEIIPLFDRDDLEDFQDRWTCVNDLDVDDSMRGRRPNPEVQLETITQVTSEAISASGSPTTSPRANSRTFNAARRPITGSSFASRSMSVAAAPK